MGSYQDCDGIYWRNGGYIGAGLHHTGRMGVTLGQCWGILEEWGLYWGRGYWGEWDHTGLGLGVLEAIREQHWEELEHDGPCHWWGSVCAGEGALWCTEGTGMSWALVQLAVSAGVWVPKALSLTGIRVPLASRCPWIKVPWGVLRDPRARVSWGTPGHWEALRCPWGSEGPGAPLEIRFPGGVCRDQGPEH